MGSNNSKVEIPAEKKEKKIQPYRFWPLRYKIEDVSVNISKQESKDEGKNLLGKNINTEEESSNDNGGGSSSSVLHNSEKEIYHDAKAAAEPTLKGNELNAVGGGRSNDHENRKKGGKDHVHETEEDSPSFKIYVIESEETAHGRKAEGNCQGTDTETMKSETDQQFHPCMTNDIPVKPNKDSNIRSEESNSNKETAETEKSNIQNGKKGGRRLLNGVWSPRDKLASMKRCVLAVSMCRSIQSLSSFDKDQRNMDKKEDVQIQSGTSRC